MHSLIRFIVEADTAEGAKECTRSALDDLLDWHEFDWYSEETSDSRWEDCWKPVRLNTKKAQASVQAAMQEQFREFKEVMSILRLMIDQYSDEQIFNEAFEQGTGQHLSRYQFCAASGYRANGCLVYDTTGSAIINQRQLDYFLKEPRHLWVVQVDCHN